MSWKDIKGIWDKKARVEAIIETQRQSYAAYKQRFPNYDTTAWLALTLSDRPHWRDQGDPWKYYLTTAVFSLAADPALVLALYIVHEEWPVGGIPLTHVAPISCGCALVAGGADPTAHA